jgi:hypothetical protein
LFSDEICVISFGAPCEPARTYRIPYRGRLVFETVTETMLPDPYRTRVIDPFETAD